MLRSIHWRVSYRPWWLRVWFVRACTNIEQRRGDSHHKTLQFASGPWAVTCDSISTARAWPSCATLCVAVSVGICCCVCASVLCVWAVMFWDTLPLDPRFLRDCIVTGGCCLLPNLCSAAAPLSGGWCNLNYVGMSTDGDANGRRDPPYCHGCRTGLSKHSRPPEGFISHVRFYYI